MVRLKHRYLLLQILYPDSPQSLPGSLVFHSPSSDTLTAASLAKTIRESVVELFGDYGAGMTSFSLVVKYLSTPTSTAIVRVTRAHYRLVWAACSSLTHIPDRGRQGMECVIRVVRVSGSIRKAELEAVRRAKEAINIGAGVAIDSEQDVMDSDED
ncbi:hypothetical protein ANO11243_038880 [Dothideomycetidae sp. 11243]|nr:hypothetical protein ANO11243_038880 [fungal sp. No.11243]